MDSKNNKALNKKIWAKKWERICLRFTFRVAKITPPFRVDNIRYVGVGNHHVGAASPSPTQICPTSIRGASYFAMHKRKSTILRGTVPLLCRYHCQIPFYDMYLSVLHQSITLYMRRGLKI